MIVNRFVRHACAAVVSLAVVGGSHVAMAQQSNPTPGALAAAREVISLKGASAIYDAIIPGVVDHAKGLFLQTNPLLGKDLNEVAAKLRTEFAPRQAELMNEAARLYASRFTEQELTDVLAFYKTPLGKKVIEEEPRILDQSMTNAQTWANRLSEELINKFRAEMKKKGHDL